MAEPAILHIVIQVRMGIEMQDCQLWMMRRMRPHRRPCHRMIAAKADNRLPARQHRRHTVMNGIMGGLTRQTGQGQITSILPQPATPRSVPVSANIFADGDTSA